MNNREVIDQVERGYRMAQPTTITYPESKTMPSEVKIAQANVYKVCYIFLCLKFSFGNRICRIILIFYRLCLSAGTGTP